LTHIRSTCRLCGSTSLEQLISFGSTPLANEYPKQPGREQDRFPLYLVGCKQCGHVQLPVVVPAERLFGADYPYQSGTSEVFRKHLEELAEAIALKDANPWDVFTPVPHPRVLDVACNDGTFVQMLREYDCKAYGIDPCAPNVEGFHRCLFNEQWAGFQKNKQGETYDVVTALNVFAHVDDLDDFTRGVATILEHDGIFIFEVGYLPDVVKAGLFDVVYHEHMSYHHLTPLVPFFRKHGMELVDAHRIDSQGGSVRCFVRNCGAHQAQSERLQALLKEETDPAREGLWNGVRALKDKAKVIGRDLMNVAKQVQMPGGILVGYGAPAKLTTMLYATGLFPPKFVVDDNPNKVGRYVPGTTCPIYPVEHLLEVGDDKTGVIVFAWNFAESIAAKLRERGYKGRIIAAMPEVRDL
jgi:SAM-dependent methyltransferase